MQFLPVPVALLISVAAGVATTGTAFPPQVEVPQAETWMNELRLVSVGGCHANVRTHQVPEFGRTTPHFHQSEDCRAGTATRQQDDRPVD